MSTNLQGSSHRPRAVGFRLRNRKDFIYEEAQPDGSVMLKVIKQYNASPVGDYLD